MPTFIQATLHGAGRTPSAPVLTRYAFLNSTISGVGVISSPSLLRVYFLTATLAVGGAAITASLAEIEFLNANISGSASIAPIEWACCHMVFDYVTTALALRSGGNLLLAATIRAGVVSQ